MAAQATKAKIEALERKLDATRDELRQELHATRDDLRSEIRANGIMLERLDAKVDAIIQALPAYAPLSALVTLDEKYQPRVSLLERIAQETTADVRKNTRRIANVEKRLKRAR